MPVADCPLCGKHNCVGETTKLNFCMWCGYAFNKEFQKQPKFNTGGQMLLFGTNYVNAS